jgi:cell division initiation protein
MKITPLDIHQRVFKKTFRGYDIDEVDEFLEKVSRSYELLFTENQRMKERLSRAEEQVKDYIEMDKALKEALLSAQQHSGQVKMNAEKQRELIIRESEFSAEKLIEAAKAEARMIMKEVARLKKQKNLIRLDIKSILDSYYEMLGFETQGSKMISKQISTMKDKDKKSS